MSWLQIKGSAFGVAALVAAFFTMSVGAVVLCRLKWWIEAGDDDVSSLLFIGC